VPKNKFFPKLLSEFEFSRQKIVKKNTKMVDLYFFGAKIQIIQVNLAFKNSKKS